jgi:hypothetical protein
MADKKVSELAAVTSLTGDDLLLVVNDPNGFPASRRITISNVFGNVAVRTIHTNRVDFDSNSFFRSTVTTFASNTVFEGEQDLQGVTRLGGWNFLGGFTTTEGPFFSNSIFTSTNLFRTDRQSNTIINNSLYANGLISVTGNATFDASTNTVFNGTVLLTGNTVIQNKGLEVFDTVRFTDTARGDSIVWTGDEFINRPSGTKVYQFKNNALDTSIIWEGPGVTFTNSDDNQTLYFNRGDTYQLENVMDDQVFNPLYIQNSDGTSYANGHSLADANGVILFTVPLGQVSDLQYQTNTTPTKTGTIVIR